MKPTLAFCAGLLTGLYLWGYLTERLFPPTATSGDRVNVIEWAP